MRHPAALSWCFGCGTMGGKQRRKSWVFVFGLQRVVGVFCLPPFGSWSLRRCWLGRSAALGSRGLPGFRVRRCLARSGEWTRKVSPPLACAGGGALVSAFCYPWSLLASRSLTRNSRIASSASYSGVPFFVLSAICCTMPCT